MKVLITGATGLIGSALTQECLAQGHAVNFLTTRKQKIAKSDNCEGFYWNPATQEIDHKALENVDVIINLAGSSIAKRWTAAYKKQIVSSRLDSLNLLKATIEKHKYNIGRLISSSAIGYYPDSLMEFYTEDYTSADTDFLSTVVQKWEAAALSFETLNIPVSLVRTGIVLDQEQGALPKLVTPIKNYVGAPLGSGQQWQSWIHINDIVGIYMHILKHNLKGIYNGVAPNPVTQKNLSKAIAKMLEIPLLLPNVPAFVLKMMLGEMHVIVTQGQRVSAEKISASGYDFEFFDINDALRNLLV